MAVHAASCAWKDFRLRCALLQAVEAVSGASAYHTMSGTRSDTPTGR
jgi:hypothetical protein